MPKPRKKEKHDDFISRCIPIVLEEGTAEDSKQGYAICQSFWDKAKKTKKKVADMEKDEAYEEFLNRVRESFQSQFPSEDVGYWLRNVFEDRVITETEEGLYEVAMTEEDGEISFAQRDDWVKVKLTYVREYVVGVFRGEFPEVPATEGVDLEALRHDDDDPFFVTLPIAKVGEISDNGLLYDEGLVESLIQQVQDKRPTGIMGHLKVEDRGSSYPAPDVYWVGAMRANGTAWAKGYIPPGKARDTLRRLKAVGGKTATSIYGPPPERRVQETDGTWRMEGFSLESLDLAPYERAALKLGGQFSVTAEMDSMNKGNVQGDDDMPSREEIIAGLKANELPEALRNTVVTEWKAEAGRTDRITELEQQVSERDKKVTGLEGQLLAFQILEFGQKVDVAIAELVAEWKVPDTSKEKVDSLLGAVRQRVVGEIGEGRDEGKIAETVQKAWTDLKPIAEMVRDALAGPPATIRGRTSKVSGDEDWRDQTAKKADELRREAGV